LFPGDHQQQWYLLGNLENLIAENLEDLAVHRILESLYIQVIP
jgi:hypothetical protein